MNADWRRCIPAGAPIQPFLARFNSLLNQPRSSRVFHPATMGTAGSLVATMRNAEAYEPLA